MAPRRQLLLLLSAIALMVSSFALSPRAAEAATVTFFVDTTADNDVAGGCTNADPNGDCSLRQAIVAANSPALANDIKIISFLYYTNGSISSSGATFVIAPPRPELPAITANDVQIVAELSSGIPRIQIDGKGASPTGQPVGLRLAGDRGLVRGLSMYGFTNSGLEPFLGSAIFISGDQNRVENSWLGIDPNGATPAGKQNFSGIRIDDGGTGNVIGGPGGETVANFISGNQQNGVIIRNSSGNFIQNNFIGLTRLNRSEVITLLGNGQYGVQIVSLNGTSANNVIGGETTGLANIIGGNGQAGILLRNTGTTSTTVQSNFVGIDKLTNTDFGNTGDGILLEEGTSSNVIGGVLLAPLVVSGNTGYGIHLRTNGPAPRNNVISGTVYIGTSIGGAGVGGVAPGTGPGLPNEAGGILVANNVIGTRIEGLDTGLRIAGNGGPGITVLGAANESTTITRALVGVVPIATNGSGPTSDDLPNAGGGILIDQARATTVLSSTISGNPLFGVRVTGGLTTTLRGNFVGPNLSRDGVFPNGGPGIELLDAGNSTVFTNTVAGHPQPGLLLRGAAGSSVLSNTVTANAGGILLESSPVSPTRVSALTGNIVSGNGLYGIRLSSALTTTLVRNYLGLGLGLSGRLPNAGNGLEIFDARNTSATDTYVAGNAGAGVVVSGTSTLTTSLVNTVAGLAFGTVGFTASEPNGGPAVRVTGGPRGTVIRSGTLGGAAADPAGTPGVLIEGTSGVTVSLLRIGWVPESDSVGAPALERPFGVGISVTGTLSDVQILTNTLRFNRGAAILVSGNAQRVTMYGNGLSRNGDAIRLAGTTILAPPRAADPGSRTNPNHDIDPPPVDVTSFSDPLRLRVGDQGIIDGFVITSTSALESGVNPVSACISCTIQIFRPGPEGPNATPGQGYILANTTSVEGGDATASFRVPDSGRFTRRLVGGVGAVGSQLLLVATDIFGNSSEYAVFPVASGFSLTREGPNQTAIPGQTVTYTLRLSNTGTLDVTGLSLRTSGTLRDWRISTDPITNTIFTGVTPLAAGSGRQITVTLTLPLGPNANVRAGITDVTTVTVIKEGTALSQSVRLETTVAPSPVLVVTPTTSLGSARPTETVPHTHVIRNNGNVTVTLGITDRTVDPVGTTGTWVTTINTRSLTLAPGEEGRVRVDVTVPDGAQVNDGQGNPVQAQTFVTATVPPGPGFGQVSINFTDTTRVNFEPDAVLLNGDQEQPGAAGQTVVFTHGVENRSNAPTRFCFVWSTNLGSTVSFVSRTDGFSIDANGCFNLDTTTNIAERRFQAAQFDAVVLVNRRALPGDREIVNISLRNQTTGELIGSAKVVDRINVLIGQRLPRLWLPVVRR